MKNDSSNGDITVNNRIRSIYKNITLSCGDNCLFVEIDKDNYTVCKCVDINKSKAFIDNILFAPFSIFNLDIVKCYYVITPVN